MTDGNDNRDPFHGAADWGANWQGGSARKRRVATDWPTEPEYQASVAADKKKRATNKWLFDAQLAASCAYDEGRQFPSARPYEWKDPAKLEPREWLYGTMIQRGHLRAILGPGGTGKTGLVIAEALAMASGKPLLGVPIVGGPHRVWLWNLEDPYDEMEKSIEAARQYWGLTPDDLGDRLLMNVAADGDAMRLAFIGEAGFQLDLALLGWIAGELTENGIDYFHFDPFVSAHGLDENSNTEIDQLAKALSIMSHQTHTATGLSHHTSKSGSINVTTHSARGAVSLTDACRSVITLNRMNDDEASGYGIEGKDARRYFNTYQDKGNRSAAADRVTWFQWKSVDLGNARDGLESDSVGAVAPWTPPDAFENVSVDHLRRVQAAIAEGEYRHHYAAADWVGNAIAPIVNLSAGKKSDRARLQKMIETWIGYGALKVETRKDANRQMKKYVVVGRSPDDHSATLDEGVA